MKLLIELYRIEISRPQGTAPPRRKLLIELYRIEITFKTDRNKRQGDF